MKKAILLFGLLTLALVSCKKEDPTPDSKTTVTTEVKDTTSNTSTNAANSIIVNDTITHTSLKGSRVPSNSYSIYKFDAGDNAFNTLQITTENASITSGTYNIVNWGKSNLRLAANAAVITYQTITPFALYRSKLGGTVQVTVEGSKVFFKFDKVDFTNDYGAAGTISGDVEAVK